MADVKDTYITTEIVPLLGITEQAVRRRAQREGWISRPRPGRGGGSEWLLSSMPEVTRLAVAAAVAQRLAAKLPAPAVISSEVFTVNTIHAVPERKRGPAAAKALLVSMAGEFAAVSGTARSVAYEVFCHEYNREAIEVPAWVREFLPRTCRASVSGWERAFGTEGLAALAGKQGLHRRGCGIIDATPGMADVVVAHIIDFYEVAAEEVLDALGVTHPGLSLPSLRNLQRWMKQYRADNPSTILKVQNPDGFKSKSQVAFGSLSADISRINQRWELDSSPTDVQLADGKRYALIGGLDVGTRRARLKLAKTSTAQGVCSLLRRMLVAFGVPETVKIDNGAEYASFQVTTVLHDLRIHPDFCKPFSPEEKPHIERFFGTFQRRLKKQPEFIGHSVADRKAIESRKSFAERISRTKGGKKEKPLWELAYTPEEFQAYCDHFCMNVYGERKHDSLGMSPNEAAAAAEGVTLRIADERALDVLLMPMPGKGGIRVVTKDGIEADNGFYISPVLGSKVGCKVGDEVLVKLDEDIAGYIYVFDLNGIFLCHAEDPNLTGVSRRDIALMAKSLQKAEMNKRVKKARKIVAKVKPRELIPMIAEMKDQQAAANRAERALRFGAEVSQEYITPALEQAALAAASRGVSRPAPMTAAEEADRAAFEARYALPKPHENTLQELSGREAFWAALELEEKVSRKEHLTPEQTRWLLGYQSTTYYSSWRAQYDRHGSSLFDGINIAMAL